MDCEKFDEHVIDALYGELDELTFAALRRHVDGCSRCAPIWNGLNQTRERAVLTMDEPSPGLERRILEAERATQRKAPWHRKALRGIAWAGSFAMRPQFAMAAVLVLVVGSSLLFLRARPGTMGSPVSVTERGNPLPESKAKEVDMDAPTQAARGRYLDSHSDGRTASAPAAADNAASETIVAPKGGVLATSDPQDGVPPPPGHVDEGKSGSADLFRADALKQSQGCDAARAEYERITRDYRGTKEAERAAATLRECVATTPPRAVPPAASSN